MKKNKIILIFAFIFLFSKSTFATEYNLRRFDTNFYNKSYENKIKFKLEKNNEKNKSKNLIRKKTKKYEGYYKVGKPYTVLGQTYYPKEQPNYNKVGMASWYGSDFHNKKTANGEIYNMNDYTAAHPTLPLPSIVRVTNLENGKSINVRVNDRGPFVKDRIIDVSKKVAKKLGFHEKGTTKVRVEFLQEETDEMLREYGLK